MVERRSKPIHTTGVAKLGISTEMSQPGRLLGIETAQYDKGLEVIGTIICKNNFLPP